MHCQGNHSDHHRPKMKRADVFRSTMTSICCSSIKVWIVIVCMKSKETHKLPTDHTNCSILNNLGEAEFENSVGRGRWSILWINHIMSYLMGVLRMMIDLLVLMSWLMMLRTRKSVLKVLIYELMISIDKPPPSYHEEEIFSTHYFR